MYAAISVDALRMYSVQLISTSLIRVFLELQRQISPNLCINDPKDNGCQTKVHHKNLMSFNSAFVALSDKLDDVMKNAEQQKNFSNVGFVNIVQRSIEDELNRMLERIQEEGIFFSLFTVNNLTIQCEWDIFDVGTIYKHFRTKFGTFMIQRRIVTIEKMQ